MVSFYTAIIYLCVFFLQLRPERSSQIPIYTFKVAVFCSPSHFSLNTPPGVDLQRLGRAFLGKRAGNEEKQICIKGAPTPQRHTRCSNTELLLFKFISAKSRPFPPTLGRVFAFELFKTRRRNQPCAIAGFIAAIIISLICVNGITTMRIACL